MTAPFTVFLHHRAVHFIMKLSDPRSLNTSFFVGTRKWMSPVHSAACFPSMGTGNPSIAPKTGGERDAVGWGVGWKHLLGQTVNSKHTFESNHTSHCGWKWQGHGQQWGRGTQQTHRLATEFEGGVRECWGGTDSISLRASGVLSEQRLFQVKN